MEKGCGIGKVQTGETIFVHSTVVQGVVLVVDAYALAQVVSDEARVEERCRARSGKEWWKEEEDKEKASKVVQQVRGAAALTAQFGGPEREKGLRGRRAAAPFARRRRRSAAIPTGRGRLVEAEPRGPEAQMCW